MLSEDKECKRCNGSGVVNMHNPPLGHMAYQPIPCPDCQEVDLFGSNLMGKERRLMVDFLKCIELR